MANTIAQKLRIREQMTLLLLHAPDNFPTHLSPLPSGVQLTDRGKIYDQIHWFVKTKAAMEKELDKVLKLLRDDVVCWIYYPKGTSALQTDLTRDKGWESLQEHTELKWISLISFDDTWSAFGIRLQTDADQPARETPQPRLIFDWADPVTKEVRLPPDFADALQSREAARTHFNALSFTNKKEYLEWIITAKKPETRQQRIQTSLEKLTARWKNPRNE